MIPSPRAAAAADRPAFVAAPASVASTAAHRGHALCRRRPTRVTRRPPVVAALDGSLPGSPDAPTHTVTVLDGAGAVVQTLAVPEDRYIWHAMEEASGGRLPSSCRHGCCTTCAVRVTSGEVDQREALGLLRQMREVGYALLCVSKPRSDITCVLQEEDEVYVKQFGDTFEQGGVEWGGVLGPDED